MGARARWTERWPLVRVPRDRPTPRKAASMSLAEKLRRVSPFAWAVVFSVLLVLPLLGTFGFWDPWELGIAERAREMTKAGALSDPAVGGRYGREPPLDLFLAALGMKLFGSNEWGARLGNGFFAILALLAVYWAGAGLFRRRAGLLAALALGTMPLFFLQARQITSDMPLICGLGLALGGLGRYAWPASGRRRGRDLLLGLAGCLLGTLSGGALLGLALPLVALLATVLASATVVPGEADPHAPALTEAAAGPDVPSETSFGRALLSRPSGYLVLGAGALGVLVLLVTLLTANVAGEYSLLLGGIPKGGPPAYGFVHLIRQIGFGLFPWSALVVFALGRALVRMSEGGEGDRATRRLAFGQLHLLVFAAFGYALSTVFVLMTGNARFAPLAPLALALGAFLDDALEGERAEPVLGLLAATGTMVVARDLFLTPAELVSLHLLGEVKWPPQLSIGPAFLVVGLIFALGIYLGLATRGRALGKVALRDVTGAGRLRLFLEKLVVTCGRWGFHAAVGAAILFTFLVTLVLVPVLSQHYSFKPVLESYERFAAPDEVIGKYRVEGHGSGFYGQRDMVELGDQGQVVEFLRAPKRAFALVNAEELAALDAALKQAGVGYHVVDASSSRFLLLSNQLRAGESDENPLKKNVWMAPSPPRAVPASDGSGHITYQWPAERPPWPAPRVSAYAEFANSIELLGADYPPVLRRPGKIDLKLHFRVNQKPPPGYKVFVHFDSPGNPRLLGDHAPLGGAFPTSHWLPGEYIKDFVEVDVPLMTTPAGTYTLLVGFWPGGERQRLKITGGNINDGVDRARVGSIDVR